jgi:hypothetical protein
VCVCVCVTCVCVCVCTRARAYHPSTTHQHDDEELLNGPTDRDGRPLVPAAIQRARDQRTGGHTRPSTIGKRASTKRSDVWNFFRALTAEEKAAGETGTHKCLIQENGQICGKNFTASGGSPSNLWKHLKGTCFQYINAAWTMKATTKANHPNHLAAVKEVMADNTSMQFKFTEPEVCVCVCVCQVCVCVRVCVCMSRNPPVITHPHTRLSMTMVMVLPVVSSGLCTLTSSPFIWTYSS